MIKEELTILYESKKNHIERFVPCGLVDEDKYNAARLKVLWILKEPNDDLETYKKNNDIWKPWNAPEQVNEQIQISEKGIKRNWSGLVMWKIVGSLSYGVQFDPMPPFVESYEEDNICKGLAKIGFTNLKKMVVGVSQIIM